MQRRVAFISAALADLGTCHFEPGKWDFYAVTHDGEGTLSFYQGTPDGRLYRICGRSSGLKRLMTRESAIDL